MDTLIIGGSGLLGNELKKHFTNVISPSRREFDVKVDFKQSLFYKNNDMKKINLVIHCAAIKNVECTKNPIEAMKTNIIGTANVAMLCNEIGAKMVYVSTDYVFKGDKGNYKTSDEVMPINYYGETKLAGEYVVKSLKNYLIIRISFFPDIFPYEIAFYDQYITRITVSEAAKKICESLDKVGIIHIAGKKQTSYEYALKTSQGKLIKKKSINFDGYIRPRDVSLLEE